MSDESENETSGFDNDAINALIDSVEEDEQDDTAALEEPKAKPVVDGKAGPSDVKKAAIGVGNVSAVDLSVRAFAPIEKYFEDKPNEVFADTSYYKTALGGEGESAQRLHSILVKYLNCTDKKDRSVYRQQVVSIYWNFLRDIAPKMANTRLPLSKRLAMRYGLLLPSLFSEEQKEFFSRAILDNYTGEPVLYMDEWIREIAVGKMKPSTTDELPVKSSPGGSQAAKNQTEIGKWSGRAQSADSLLNMKEAQRDNLELELKSRIDGICEHIPMYNLERHKACYSDDQKRSFTDAGNIMRELQKLDREIEKCLNELQDANAHIEALETEKAGLDMAGDTANLDKETILGEMDTMKQMAKMTCGRQGNQFPVLTREFFHCTQTGTGFRENVIRELAWIESIDPGCFVRIHKNLPNRIVPYVMLAPTYGDSGFCWEPFDRYNRITSRGRIAIPMYPRNLKVACLTAVADLRWQVAKEKASFDWMSDGLTGLYYQWIESQKLKGDLKQFFIADYIMWITKESLGQQKLPKEVRAIFWRYMPFPQETKDKLKKMSLTYQELYQRDINRSMSDGY